MIVVQDMRVAAAAFLTSHGVSAVCVREGGGSTCELMSGVLQVYEPGLVASLRNVASRRVAFAFEPCPGMTTLVFYGDDASPVARRVARQLEQLEHMSQVW